MSSLCLFVALLRWLDPSGQCSAVGQNGPLPLVCSVRADAASASPLLPVGRPLCGFSSGHFPLLFQCFFLFPLSCKKQAGSPGSVFLCSLAVLSSHSVLGSTNPRNAMQSTCVTLGFLVARFKKSKETGEIHRTYFIYPGYPKYYFNM